MVNPSGITSELRLQKIISIDGVPFDFVPPPDLASLSDRVRILEHLLGELLSQLQPQQEFCSAESPSPQEEPLPSQPEFQPPTPEEQPEA